MSKDEEYKAPFFCPSAPMLYTGYQYSHIINLHEAANLKLPEGRAQYSITHPSGCDSFLPQLSILYYCYKQGRQHHFVRTDFPLSVYLSVCIFVEFTQVN
jgi:hypothetical protein